MCVHFWKRADGKSRTAPNVLVGMGSSACTFDVCKSYGTWISNHRDASVDFGKIWHLTLLFVFVLIWKSKNCEQWGFRVVIVLHYRVRYMHVKCGWGQFICIKINIWLRVQLHIECVVLFSNNNNKNATWIAAISPSTKPFKWSETMAGKNGYPLPTSIIIKVNSQL